MSILTDLLVTLTDNEIKHLRTLNLTQRENEVLDKIIQYSKVDKTDKDLQQELALTKSHFDKLNSTLFDKALEHLAGEILVDKLHFLIDKQLSALVTHKLKLEEKKLKKLNDKQALKNFYLMAFNAVVRYNFNNFPVEMLLEYCDAYISYLDKDDEENKYKVIAQAQAQIIRYYKFRQNKDEKTEEAFAILSKIEKDIEGKNLYTAEVNLFVALSAYHEMYNKDKTLDYITRAEEVANKISDKLDDRIKAFISVIKAGFLMDGGRFNEAINYYHRAITDYPILVGQRMFHTYNYTYCLLIEGLYDDAFKAIKKYLSPFLQNESAKNFHFDVLRIYVTYYLLTNNLGEAEPYVKRLQQFSKEEFTPYGDGLWRFAHNLYIAQSGDYILATDLVKKNLKFIYSKPEIHNFDVFKEMFLTLGTMIRIKQGLSNVKANSLDKQMDLLYNKSRMHYRLLKNFEEGY
jgi:hypothetical protein